MVYVYETDDWGLSSMIINMHVIKNERRIYTIIDIVRRLGDPCGHCYYEYFIDAYDIDSHDIDTHDTDDTADINNQNRVHEYAGGWWYD